MAGDEPKVNHFHIYAVAGSLSITLIKMVVKTSMFVRFTVRPASKKTGLKWVVASVIRMRKTVGM